MEVVSEMSDIVYNNKALAKEACEQYVAAMCDLREKLGVWEENEDSCASIYIYAKHLSDNGKVVKYCHDDP